MRFEISQFVEVTVSEIVTDEKGDPLPGASVTFALNVT